MDKREKIIQASITVFKEKGIEKTKISDIVKKAEIAQGTFYLYFPSKLSVMPVIAEKIVVEFMKAINEKVQKDRALTEKLSQLIDAIFYVTGEFRDVCALVYAGLSSTEQMSRWEEIYMPLYELVGEMLADSQSRQQIRETIDVKRTARLVIGVVESAAEQVYLYDAFDAENEASQKAELLIFLESALRS